MSGFDYDAHTNRLLNDHLDKQGEEPCEDCGNYEDECECGMPDEDAAYEDDDQRYGGNDNPFGD